jgi:farnesyl diphosphate synthase
MGGGKRIRPYLVINSAGLFDVHNDYALRTAAAIEMLHCYSLVHDDLPAMDDSDLRRGRKTVHKEFDEATAILAGDALLTLAFDILARPSTDPDPAIRVALVSGLASAAGLGGMAGGQMIDIRPTRRKPRGADITIMHGMKTGALFRFAAEAGAILGRASETERTAFAAFGEKLGLAFQFRDDLIDATGSAAKAGKATAKDARRGKATLVALHGVDRAEAMLEAMIADAVTELEPFGERADMLGEVARFVGEREG